MLQFDTSGLGTAQRLQHITRHLTGALGACRVTHLCDEEAVWGRWRSVQLSRTTTICRYDGSAVRMTRRAADVAADPTGWLTFAVPTSGGSTLWQHGWLRQVSAGELVLLDLGSPYDLRAVEGVCSLVQTERTSLGVSPAQVRAAALGLAHSPLHDLTRDHVRELARVSCPPTPVPAAASAVATATLRLLGALILSTELGASNGSPPR